MSRPSVRDRKNGAGVRVPTPDLEPGVKRDRPVSSNPMMTSGLSVGAASSAALAAEDEGPKLARATEQYDDFINARVTRQARMLLKEFSLECEREGLASQFQQVITSLLEELSVPHRREEIKAMLKEKYGVKDPY